MLYTTFPQQLHAKTCANCKIFGWKQPDLDAQSLEAARYGDQALEEVHGMPRALLLQQGVPGGALEEGTQGPLQVPLSKQGAQQGGLQTLHHGGGGWGGGLQGGKPQLHLLLQYDQESKG